ncbi:MAG: hypothetical protein Ct9H300mP14_02120 [Gammaproteobacteria bacterium]|nr:MAG: hypothetical protein Ct9H300mP14_02120 [Gammaproteobacteria bacterium]
MPQDLKSTLVDPFISVATTKPESVSESRIRLPTFVAMILLKQLRVGLVQDVGQTEDRCRLPAACAIQQYAAEPF